MMDCDHDAKKERYQPRPFACLSCHKILGWVVRRGNATHLDILRIPHDAGSAMPEGLSQWAFRGEVLNGRIPCTCGKSRKWVVGESAMHRLLESNPEALKKYQELAEK